MRKSIFSLIIIVGAVMLIGSSGPLWAQTPPITLAIIKVTSGYKF